MVERQPSKLNMRVRSSLPAPAHASNEAVLDTIERGFISSYSSVGRALPW